MADANERKKQLEAERNLQQELVNSAKTQLFLSEKARDVKQELLDKLSEETDLGSQIEDVQRAIDDLLLEQIERGDLVNQHYINQLDTLKEQLTTQKKINDKEEERKNISEDIKDHMLGELGLIGKIASGVAIGTIAADLFKQAFSAVVSELKATAGAAMDFYKTMGASVGESARMGSELVKARFSMEGLLSDGDAFVASANEAADYFGTTASVQSGMIESMTKLKRLGADGAGAALMADQFERASGNASELTDNITDIAQNSGAVASKVFKDMSENAGMLVGATTEQVKQLGKVTAELVKAGLSMSQMRDMSDNVLNIEQSLNAEMKARAFGMGEYLGQVNEVKNAAMAIQFGNADEQAQGVEDMKSALDAAGISSQALNDMGYKQRQMLAESYGMTADQLSKFVVATENGEDAMKAMNGEAEEASWLDQWGPLIGAIVAGGVLLVGIVWGLSAAFPALGAGLTAATAPMAAFGAAGLAAVPIMLAIAAVGIALAAVIVSIGYAINLVLTGIGSLVESFGTFFTSFGAFMASITTDQVKNVALLGLAFIPLAYGLGSLIIPGMLAIPVLTGVGLAMIPLAAGLKMVSSVDLSSVVTQLSSLGGVSDELLLMGVALMSIAAGLSMIAVAGFMALPIIGALTMFAAVAPALTGLAGMFGMGGESTETTTSQSESSNQDVIDAIMSLGNDIKNRPIQIVMNGKVISTVNQELKTLNKK